MTPNNKMDASVALIHPPHDNDDTASKSNHPPVVNPPPAVSMSWLNKLAKKNTELLTTFFAMEPIHVDYDAKTKQSFVGKRCQGDDLIALWQEHIWSNENDVQSIVVETSTGPSTPGQDYVSSIDSNPVFPYEQLRSLVGDGGKWKWPLIWKQLDLLPRRGKAWRHIEDPANLGQIDNPNPHIVPLNCLVVGGGPVGLRLAIELVLGGHRVTLYEKRRETRDPTTGILTAVGFTNRVNRPHLNNVCRNDLDRLNGRNFMTTQMCYPVFTNTQTSSIGIDECQMLLLKTALLLGVRFELGVGYQNATMDVEDELGSQRPTWLVEYTADEIAQRMYGKVATNGVQRFDALFGCDGGQSRVRNSQSEWLGTPHFRSYKKMLGIVSNIRKCSPSKVVELVGSSLEPDDRAGLQTGVYFYKASYHNYLIVHPSAEEMAEHGIPWKGVYSFDQADQNKTKGSHDDDTKAILKKFMTQKAQSLGIPIDPSLPNDGFVDAPNDVMAFDFSEFYNCEKSAAARIPPLDWNAQVDGDWDVSCPLVAIAGDAVADPNWLLGVGLQRGWNSALDATFYADNLYNNLSFNGKPPTKDDPISQEIDWSEHMDNVAMLMETLGLAARESRLSKEMSDGVLDPKGPVVNQINRKLKVFNTDPPVPQYLPPVEPWGRYKVFEKEVAKNFRGRSSYENVHPLATRELAIYHHNEAFVKRGMSARRQTSRPSAALLTWPKRFECSAFWGMMEMIEIKHQKVVRSAPVRSRNPTSQTQGPVNGRHAVSNLLATSVRTKAPVGVATLKSQCQNAIKSIVKKKRYSPPTKREATTNNAGRQEEPSGLDGFVEIPRSVRTEHRHPSSDTAHTQERDLVAAKLTCAKKDVEKIKWQQTMLAQKLAFAEEDVELLSNLISEFDKVGRYIEV